MKPIITRFGVTPDEYNLLMKKFERYCYYIAWQLKKNNSRNNSTDELDDIIQQLRFAVVKAASYHKRQTFIEACLDALTPRIKDDFTKKVLKSLKRLWKNRTRHGANRQKFGDFQEILLERLVRKYVPKSKRPRKAAPLVIDAYFATYCKQITWNEQRAMGKKITREKPLRVGMASLSEFDYLGAL